jgi:hypothetical protein
MGLLQRAIEHPAEAERCYEQAGQLWSELAAEHPGSAVLEDHWAVALNNLAEVLNLRNRTGEAVALAQHAVALERAVCVRAPSTTEYRANLGNFYTTLAAALCMENRLAGVVETAKERLALWPNDEAQLVVAARDVARCIPRAKPGAPPPSSKALADHALALLERAVGTNPAIVKSLSEAEEFVPLRADPRFQALVMDRAFPAQPFAGPNP